MTITEADFKQDCRRLLRSGRIPTPKALHTLGGWGNGRNLNGDKCRWRVEVMREFGCVLVGTGPSARWRLP